MKFLKKFSLGQLCSMIGHSKQIKFIYVKFPKKILLWVTVSCVFEKDCSLIKNYQLSRFQYSDVEMKVSYLKNGCKGMHAKYMQYKYTFFHKVVYIWIVFYHFYLMVCIQTVKDNRCKIKMWDTLLPQKWSVEAEILFSV